MRSFTLCIFLYFSLDAISTHIVINHTNTHTTDKHFIFVVFVCFLQKRGEKNANYLLRGTRQVGMLFGHPTIFFFSKKSWLLKRRLPVQSLQNGYSSLCRQLRTQFGGRLPIELIYNIYFSELLACWLKHIFVQPIRIFNLNNIFFGIGEMERRINFSISFFWILFFGNDNAINLRLGGFSAVQIDLLQSTQIFFSELFLHQDTLCEWKSGEKCLCLRFFEFVSSGRKLWTREKKNDFISRRLWRSTALAN